MNNNLIKIDGTLNGKIVDIWKVPGHKYYVRGKMENIPSIYMKVFVYDLKKTLTVDIYDDIRECANTQSISSNLFDVVHSHKNENIKLGIRSGNPDGEYRLITKLQPSLAIFDKKINCLVVDPEFLVRKK